MVLKRKTALTALTAVLVLACMALVGCGASVDYFYSSDGEYAYFEWDLNVPTVLQRDLEETAANKIYGGKWTIGEWLRECMLRFGYTSESESSTGSGTAGMKVYKYRRQILLSDLEDSDDSGEEEETDENYSREVENLFFLYRVTVTSSNPLNGLREQYDNAEQGDGSIFSVIRYGLSETVNGQTAVILPSLFDAFPDLEKRDLSSLVMNYYMPAPKTGGTTGTTVVKDYVKYYKFESKFDGSDEVIVYSYYTLCALGWYTVIIVVGCVLVLVILLATGKKKKPDPPDIFPYDPEYNNDGANNLPSGYNIRF